MIRSQIANVDIRWAITITVMVLRSSDRVWRIIDSDTTSSELKFIGMWKSGRWTLGANLNLARPLRPDAQQGTTAEVDGKVAYRVVNGQEMDLQLGVEHYAGLGTLKNLYASNERTAMTFLVADFGFKGWDFNLGLGQATGATQDKVVLKAIIGVPF